MKYKEKDFEVCAMADRVGVNPTAQFSPYNSCYETIAEALNKLSETEIIYKVVYILGLGTDPKFNMAKYKLIYI